MLNNIHQAIDRHYDEMVEIRRYLHQYPEVSFKEFETAKYIANFYEQIGIPYDTNIGGNGVIARLQGAKPGKTIALRADFDALPIDDQKDVPYKSKRKGAMHACGHDGHTATLLILAKVMQQFQNELEGTIVFLHQHAEEIPPGGAISILESGILDDVDAIFGSHLWTPTSFGEVTTKTGPFMAGADQFTITIKGKGGHGGYPHDTKDAILIGAEVTTHMQNIISRRVSPFQTAVITIGKFEAGTSFNIIADEATLTGTVRYLDSNVQQIVKEEMTRVVKGICLANDATYEIDYLDGYPPVINHEAETALVFNAAQKVATVNEATVSEPQMAGEDFAHYLRKIPGAYFFTGAKIDGYEYPHHHPMFDFNEYAMPIAAKMLIGAYVEYQQEHPAT